MRIVTMMKAALLMGATLVITAFPTMNVSAKNVSMKEYRSISNVKFDKNSVTEEDMTRAENMYNQLKASSKKYEMFTFANEEELEVLQRAIFVIQGSHFYYEQFKTSTFSSKNGSGYIYIKPEEIRTLKKENEYIRKQVKKAIKSMKITKKTSEKKAIKKINNYMKKKYDYDWSYSNRSAYEMMKEKTGVCEAYAEVFKALCGYVGIKVECVIGNNNTHEWNKVSCNGKWYYTDITWNDTAKTSRYLLMTSKKLRKDKDYELDYVVPTTIVNMSKCIQ